MKESRKPNF